MRPPSQPSPNGEEQNHPFPLGGNKKGGISTLFTPKPPKGA
jgi:hypothetical protein